MGRGILDFRIHPCRVVLDTECATRFSIHPLGGGRIFFFDTSDSEHSRAKWQEVVQEHLAHGACRGCNQSAKNNFEANADLGEMKCLSTVGNRSVESSGA